MPNVLEMAAKFGNQPASNGVTLAHKPEVRKWQSPSNTRPPIGNKPNFGSTASSGDNIPEWKRVVLQKREQQKMKNEAEKKEVDKTNEDISHKNNGFVNSYRSNGDVLPNKSNYPSSNGTFLSSQLASQNRNSSALWKKNIDSKPTNANLAPTTKKIETEANKQAEDSFQQNQSNQLQRGAFLSDAIRRTSSSSVSESVQSCQSEISRNAVNHENEFPSGGSFASVDSQNTTSSTTTSDCQQQDEPTQPGIGKGRVSFLHHRSSTSSAADIQPTTSASPERRRRSLPSHVYKETPPEKPRKPLNARLPGQPELGYQRSPLPPTPLGPQERALPPAPRGGHPEPMISRPPPNVPGRHPSSSLPPALPARNPSSSSFQDRPLPSCPGLPNISDHPIPPISEIPSGSGSGTFSPSTRPPLPIPGEPPCGGQRRLPPVPDGQHPPLPPITDRPPLSPPNGRRQDSFPDLQMPPGNPITRQRQPSLIKTWEQEEEEGNYDETAVSCSPPPLPPDDRARSIPPVVELSAENEDDVYEETGQNSSLSSLPQTPSKDDDKKKKDADKKEKEMRKKFKLPLDGEISVQTTGTIKCDSKWFEKFSVHARDVVDVIRTTDNPKGKWLIRTKKGIYGYVDSDNIEMDMDAIRQSMLAMGSTENKRAASPLPPMNSNYRAAVDPLMVEDQTYDDTGGGEELYEEL